MLRSTTSSRLDACKKAAATTSCASCVRVNFIEADAVTPICSRGFGCVVRPIAMDADSTGERAIPAADNAVLVEQLVWPQLADFDVAVADFCRAHGQVPSTARLNDAASRDVGSAIREGLVLNPAEVTAEVPVPVVDENALLAILEARLADEMRGLGLSLREFALRTKAIREEIPKSAKFCKLVAGFFPLAAFQLADALLSETQGFTFKDDGALYLKQLGLEIEDFVRELDLEGRKFLAVAFVDKSGRNVLDGTANGDEL
ncbi:hypothetical protein GCM10027082_24270 [Comamonas humi]